MNYRGPRLMDFNRPITHDDVLYARSIIEAYRRQADMIDATGWAEAAFPSESELYRWRYVGSSLALGSKA